MSLFWSQSHSSSTRVDNINDFPGEIQILTHLLSFLPTREAFRITVLSKRWHPLSYSLSNPVIDDRRVQNSEDLIQFRQFIDAVMFSPPNPKIFSSQLYVWTHSGRMRVTVSTDGLKLQNTATLRFSVYTFHIFYTSLWHLPSSAAKPLWIWHCRIFVLPLCFIVLLIFLCSKPFIYLQFNLKIWLDFMKDNLIMHPPLSASVIYYYIVSSFYSLKL